MKKNSYIGIVLLIILLTSCFGRDSRLKFINNSNSSIYVEISSDSSFINIEEHLKKIFTKDRYESHFIASSKYFEYFKPYETDSIELMSKNGWIKMVNKSKNKTLYFFIIQDSVAVATRYGSNYVMKHNLCERRAYTLEDLEKTNWVVTYP